MSFLVFIFQLLMIAIVIILVYQTLKYTRTMWRFKNRKKDGSEDKDFKYFD
jgi:heme/copper-type cytochrome/quinol oxidase subunit 2